MNKTEPTHIEVERSYMGSLTLSTVKHSRRIAMNYYGYSETTAKKLFKQYLKTVKE